MDSGHWKCFLLTIGRNSKLLGFTYFDFLDFLTSNASLTGLLIAVFVGYIISPRIIDSQMNSNTRWKSSWITLPSLSPRLRF